ncbi:MAG: SGNH/GDSL hydrolase family protein, partial [Lachnospiraceae bacterium]|nr:SGNH/GDSL hydrolase family protein [Lachnospiraceae bacterium]
MSKIGEIDKNLAVPGTIQGENLNFYNVRYDPFAIYGLLPGREGEPFRRLPLEVAEKTSPGVRALHTNTSGGRVRFKTDSSRIAIRAVMPNKCLMAHMPFLGSSGFDLYVTEGGTYLYKGSFMPPVNREGSYESLINLETREMRDITINFPLYDGVNELYIGLEPDATLEEGGTYRPEQPIIYYGSSITQGGCASRPGNSYSNIITR